MKIGIYTNYSKDKNWEVTDKVIEILKNNGFETKCFSMETAGTKGCDYSDLDSLVIIGGDGTILYNATQCMEADIPLVTINKGTVGFLSEVHQNELDKLADLLNRKNITDNSIRFLDYNNGILFSSQMRTVSASHILLCTSPIWAEPSISIQSRD